MTEALFGFVTGYGLPVIALVVFLSCLAVPIPAFVVMLTGGAFAASGDLVLWQVLAAAYVAALLGDQVGFQIGRWAGRAVIMALERRPGSTALIARAEAQVAAWGSMAVFFSRWLVSPLGPWVNLIGGAAGMGRLRFSLWDAAGEAIWVAAYVLLGYLFGARLPQLVDLVGNSAGLVTSAGLTAMLGAVLLRKALKRHTHAKTTDTAPRRF